MVGRPSVVSDEGTDEKPDNGEAGAPEGAKTGFDAVVRDAGADDTGTVCARTEVISAVKTSKEVNLCTKANIAIELFDTRSLLSLQLQVCNAVKSFIILSIHSSGFQAAKLRFNFRGKTGPYLCCRTPGDGWLSYRSQASGRRLY
jgi:hypothetical protein